jgi:hypothetical protein
MQEYRVYTVKLKMSIQVHRIYRGSESNHVQLHSITLGMYSTRQLMYPILSSVTDHNNNTM